MAEPIVDLRDALGAAAEPRPPAPDFAARLRAELVDGDETFDELVVPLLRAPRPHRAPVLAAAAVIAVIAVAIGVVLIGGGNQAVETAPAAQPAPTGRARDLDGGRAACELFRATAFAPRQRSQVVGAGNADTLPTVEAARDAATQLQAAASTLRTSLRSAGLESRRVADALDRLDSWVLTSLKSSGRGNLTTATGNLAAVDDQLVQLNNALTLQGLGGCT